MGRWSVLGLSLAGGVVLALAVSNSAEAPPFAALVGLAALAIGAALNPRAQLVRGIVLSVPGAALLGFAGDLDRPSWLATATAVAAVLAVPLVVASDRAWSDTRGVPLAFFISALGVYYCLPDTEEARLLFPVAGVVALVAFVAPFRSFGRAGAAACTGLLLWIAAFDARGRPAAFIGAALALGMLLTAAVGDRLRGDRTPWLRGRTGAVMLLLGHAALVGWASRVVGLEHSVRTAALLTVPGIAGAIVLSVLADPSSEGVTRSP